MRHHVSQGIELRKRKSKILTKRTRVSPILFTLRLVTALYFAMALSLSCCLFLPARAEETSTRDNWKIAKANVERFLGLDDKTLAALFGRVPVYRECNIFMDEKTSLRFGDEIKVKEFSFLPQTEPSKLGIWGLDEDGEHPNVRSEKVWTGAKRKDEKEYWSIIKANLDKFIGMSSEEITALLGPERCSSKPWNRIDYRIGDAGLTFYLKDGKVEKFRFKSNVYIPGT